MMTRHSGGMRAFGVCREFDCGDGGAISKLPLTLVGGGTPAKHS